VVTITDRGRAVAQLIPIATSPLNTLVTAGRARPAKGSLADLGLPPKRPAGTPPLSSVLAAMRADERW
jgi:antitoxin (DNA-binding transcriptional repressor) of toxin-antitoxin stability system